MKYLGFFALLLCTVVAFPQIQQGTMVVGGKLNLNGGNTISFDPAGYDGDHKSGSYGLSGSFEKFVNSSTALGLFLGYSYTSRKSEYDFGTDTNTYGEREHLIVLGPQFSKYITIREKFYFTVQTSAYFGIGNNKDRETDEKSNILTAGVSANPGLAFFLNDNFALSAGIGSLYYSFTSEKSTEENVDGEKYKRTSHDYGLSFNVNTFSIGLKYFLRTAKSE